MVTAVTTAVAAQTTATLRLPSGSSVTRAAFTTPAMTTPRQNPIATTVYRGMSTSPQKELNPVQERNVNQYDSTCRAQRNAQTFLTGFHTLKELAHDCHS
jgi:hypothetical protein